MNEDMQNKVIDLDVTNNTSNNLEKSFDQKKYIVVGLLLLSVVMVGAGVFVFINKNNKATDSITTKDVATLNGLGGTAETLFDQGAKTHPSPINGVLYTDKQYEVFSNRRPLAVMMNNHVLARPQFGVSYADIVYEIVAEGGITRWLTIFHSQGAGQVGPVRSARVYYASIGLDIILIMHTGVEPMLILLILKILQT